jgi:hypothetical protein
MTKTLNVVKNNTIETQWLTIKSKFDAGNYDLNEMDHLTCDLLAQLAYLTVQGYTEIEGTSIDKSKERVWRLVERMGLLPEYKDEDLEDVLEIKDDWDSYDEEDTVEINDEEFYR